MSSLDFRRVDLFLKRGVAAGEAGAERLQALALPADAWAQRVARREGHSAEPPLVEFVRADLDSQRYRPEIDRALGGLVGAPLSAGQTARALTRLYGDGRFETLDYRLVRDEQDRAGLEVAARPKSWGPNYLRFGLELQDDFEGGNSFSAGARLLFTEINRYGGELQLDIKTGEDPLLLAEIYQPLAPASQWFVAPRAQVERRSFDFIEDDQRLAEYRIRSSGFGLDIGRELENWGELRVGVRRASGSARVRIGDVNGGIPARIDVEQGDVFARFGLDQLDSVYFPRDGQSLTLEWTGGRESLGADYDADRLTIDGLLARSVGRHTGVLWLTGGTNLSGPRNAVQDFYTLGGLFNLSGRVVDSLSGPHFAIARGLYYWRVGGGGEGFLNVPTYAGLSLELGNVWQRRGDISASSALLNGALFVGIDTPLGPIYLAAGIEEGGSSSLYLLLGRLR